MKLTHFKYFFIYHIRDSIYFYFNLISLFSFFITIFFIFSWKISNFADGYWFLYSNKKIIFELKYIY